MKTLAQIGAGLSFASFFLAGAVILAATAFQTSGEYVLLTAFGLFLVGIAFFAGSMLWLAAEKSAMNHPRREVGVPVHQWPPKIFVRAICALFGAVVAIFLIRVLCSASLVHPSAIPATP
ncbi:MAG: hypothetical protein HY301_20795 [Verrucomicrobia bacterium]|nr:hypothetical protein [Verrucomicrobiota bacterium]